MNTIGSRRSTDLPSADAARARLGEALYRYVMGIPPALPVDTADPNAGAFARYRLVPRLMQGHTTIDIRASLCGRAFEAPLAIGAFAADRVMHGEGLLPVARVCQRLGLPLMISEETVTPLAEITAVHDGCWLQLRAAGPRDRATRLAETAARCGIRGIVLTLLAPAHPNAGSQPGGYSIGSELARRGWSTIGSEGAPGLGAVPAWPQWSWADVAELAKLCSAQGLSVIAKGVLRPEDAARAAAAGCGGVIVSNIGLRQCRQWALPLDCAADIRPHVSATLLLEGGVRSGVDALIACCLGADMAVVVRPVVMALAAGGETAVADLLGRWLDEMAAVASWLGAGSLADLDPSYLRLSVAP